MTDMVRVHAVADDLRGSARNLSDFATPEECRDTDFLLALDELVLECECCGWWVDADECDDDQHCEDCQRES